jgi:ArsR family transcriptional regulator
MTRTKTRRARDRQLAALNTTLRALADPTRLRILALLGGGEVCVCHIHDALNVPQPTASRHLAYLRRAGLVDARRDGMWVHYSLNHVQDEVLRTVVHTVTHCVGHVETVARDRKRLEDATGCCTVALPTVSEAPAAFVRMPSGG